MGNLAVRDDAGWFVARHTDLELIRLVGCVARQMRPDDPIGLTQDEFDTHRFAGVGVGAECPTARAVYMRVASRGDLKLPWRDVVRAGVGGGANSRQTLAAASRTVSATPVSERVVYFALRLAERHLGVPPATAGEYDRARDELTAKNRSSRLPALLPASSQIVRHSGSWSDALGMAGFPTSFGRTRT